MEKSVRTLTVYTIYLRFSISNYITTVTFADDTSLLASHSDPRMTSTSIKNPLIKTESCLNRQRVKVNELKSVKVTNCTFKESLSTVTID